MEDRIRGTFCLGHTQKPEKKLQGKQNTMLQINYVINAIDTDNKLKVVINIGPQKIKLSKSIF